MQPLLNILEQYQTPLVRDLVWALLSPTLINTHNNNYNPSRRWYQEAFHLVEPQLSLLDQGNAKLQEPLDTTHKQRLGHYFEDLWHWWLLHNGRYQILARNLQVIVDQKTLGEFDFIVRDTHADQIEHWELAVKFYLGIPPLNNMQHWMGTNHRDRLDQKYHHLRTKQLILSETHAGRQLCQQHGWNIQQKRLISKGRLYYPYSEDHSHPVEIPHSIDHQHLVGYWMAQSDFLQQAAHKTEGRYLLLEAAEWLVHQQTGFKPLACIQSPLMQSSHPQQLLVQQWQKNPFRLFVVPDDWEAQALASLANTHGQ